jgi:hypothetical protein
MDYAEKVCDENALAYLSQASANKKRAFKTITTSDNVAKMFFFARMVRTNMTYRDKYAIT